MKRNTHKKPEPQRNIPNGLQIERYMVCVICLAEAEDGVTPVEYQDVAVGSTSIGWQVWCKRHHRNIVHIDFEGQVHPANLTCEPYDALDMRPSPSAAVH